MGGQIKGDAKTLLASSQVLPIKLVGFFYRTESSVLDDDTWSATEGAERGHDGHPVRAIKVSLKVVVVVVVVV